MCELSSSVPGPVPWLAAVLCDLGMPPASEETVNRSYVPLNVEISETMALGCGQIHIVDTEPTVCCAWSSVVRSGCTFSKQFPFVGVGFCVVLFWVFLAGS